jgi:hypothetical protein
LSASFGAARSRLPGEGGQIVDATVIQARRPRLSKDEKATVKAGAVPEGWSKAKRAQKARPQALG